MLTCHKLLFEKGVKRSDTEYLKFVTTLFDYSDTYVSAINTKKKYIFLKFFFPIKIRKFGTENYQSIFQIFHVKKYSSKVLLF